MEGFRDLSPQDQTAFIQNLERQGIYKTAEGFTGIDMPQLQDIFANTAAKNLKQFINFEMPEVGTGGATLGQTLGGLLPEGSFDPAADPSQIAMQNRFNLITGTGAPTISTSDLNTENLTAGENTVDSQLNQALQVLKSLGSIDPETLKALTSLD
jgi:hypothetical protein